MQGPSYQDIEAMRKLRQILNGNIDDSKSTHQQIDESKSYSKPIFSGRPEVDAMAAILQKFYAASGNTVERLVEDSEYNPKLKEALQTKSTATGAIIGKWEVKIHLSESEGKSRKIYDIVNPTTNENIHSGLAIFEAAHAIVRYLNKGLNSNHTKIQEILDLEETYNRNRIDAMRFKHRYNRCKELNERQAGEVFANRFQVARANAISAQDQIKSILEAIR